MDFLDRVFLDNTGAEWLTAIALTVGVAIALRVIVRQVLRAFDRWAERTHSRLDDLLATLARRTRPWFYLTAGLYVGSRPLDLPPLVRDAFEKAVIIGALLQVGIWASTAASGLIRIYQRNRYGDDLTHVTAFKLLDLISRFVIWLVVILLALANVGVDVTALVTGLGIGGIAVALAVQSTLADLLASLTIVFDKPFVVGDYIVLGEFKGNVESIGIKTTHIRSISGEQIVISNADLLKSRIRNYGRMEERRGDFRIGVVYQTPEEKVARIPEMIREAIEAHDNTRFARSHFSQFGDFSLNFDTVYFMLVPDYNAFMDTQQSINLELMRRFEEEGIEFAYPTQQLYVSGVLDEPPAVDGS